MHDLVLRSGTIVDGTGGPPVVGDVAVDDGRITEVGRVTSRGREEIDAADRLVTPGFVDPHTHYDGQATWDPLLTPSIWHGVTTVVMGNCGVGFAPVAPDRRDWLIGLMEGVEDIPGTALAEGIRWDWESVTEYLDALDRFPRAIDVAAQVTHGSVRAHVMGERGAANEPATDDDVARMAVIVREGIAAGALGFSTNRLPLHMAVDGRPVPGTYADARELEALAEAVRAARPDALLQAITAGSVGGDEAWPEEIDLLASLSRGSGLRCTFTFGQARTNPEQWRDLLVQVDGHNATGARLVPQVACRPLGILVGLRTRHAWIGRPSYEEVAHLPVEEQARRLADPERKARILGEGDAPDATPLIRWLTELPHFIFPQEAPADHEPGPEQSLAGLAAAARRRPEELMYDLMLQDEGRQLFQFMLDGYVHSNLDHTFELLSRPDVVLGLGDGGAHVSLLCDASYPTLLLAHWVRDRRRGPRLPLELAVRKLTSEPAALFGLHDRGVLRPGAKADLNVIDFDRLAMRPPEILHDLPAGARRLVQRADGYEATIVSGVVVDRGGEDTGERPGRLVRGGPLAAAQTR